MIRVVLDTNILLSSLLQPLGPPAKVMYLARRGFLQVCVSGPIYAEYEEVIRVLSASLRDEVRAA